MWAAWLLESGLDVMVPISWSFGGMRVDCATPPGFPRSVPQWRPNLVELYADTYRLDSVPLELV